MTVNNIEYRRKLYGEIIRKAIWNSKRRNLDENDITMLVSECMEVENADCEENYNGNHRQEQGF